MQCRNNSATGTTPVSNTWSAGFCELCMYESFFWLFSVITVIKWANTSKCQSGWFDLKCHCTPWHFQGVCFSTGAYIACWNKEIQSRGKLLRRDKEGLLASPPGSHFSVKWPEQSLIYYWSTGSIRLVCVYIKEGFFFYCPSKYLLSFKKHLAYFIGL